MVIQIPMDTTPRTAGDSMKTRDGREYVSSFWETGTSSLRRASTAGIHGHYSPEAPFRNGLAYILPCVLSQLPLDMICVKLGSNDFSPELEPTPERVAENAAKVLRLAREASEEAYPGRSCKYVLMGAAESDGGCAQG